MKSVAFHNLGCKVNSYELEVMQQNLQENGFFIVSFDEIADIYVINTCTVTNIADKKSRQMLHRARQKNPDAIVVAVGCYVQIDEEALKDASIDLAIGNNKKKDLLPLLMEYIENRESKTLAGKTILDINSVNEYEEMHLLKPQNRNRTFVKIQDGCNQFCAYCIIPYVRGRVRSRKAEAVIAELTELVNIGCREAVLVGINLSSYGNDLSEKDALLNLIKKAAAIPNLKRIHLGSLEPRLVTREFAAGLAAIPKLSPHFHLSLQSGCDTTLKRMNRHYTIAEYYEKVKILREAFKEPVITTDVIVGFPGETDEEFAETEVFIKQVSFADIHVFQYSKRKGTKAYEMPGQVPSTVRKERSNRLLMNNH